MSGAVHYTLDTTGQTPESIHLNAGRDIVTLRVANVGDRAIQVGSHYHFYEVNPGLRFDRELAWGKHLNIASGLAVRFEPGDVREVTLVDFGGTRTIYGFAGLVSGQLDDPAVHTQAQKKLQAFLGENE